jgi:hypothetical protein
MINALIQDFNKEVSSKFKARNDRDYIEAGRRYLREVLETVKDISDSIRDSTDDPYQKIAFDRSCDAINVLLYNHLSSDLFKGLSIGTEEQKRQFAELIEEKHQTFTV